MALRFVPSGNIEAAGRLKGVSWRLLHDLKRRMSFQKLFQDKTVLRTEDGTIIECSVCGALDTINIFVPEIEVVKEVEVTGIEKIGYRVYSVIFEKDGWEDIVKANEPLTADDVYKRVYVRIDSSGAAKELSLQEIEAYVVIKDIMSEFLYRPWEASETYHEDNSVDFTYTKEPWKNPVTTRAMPLEPPATAMYSLPLKSIKEKGDYGKDNWKYYVYRGLAIKEFPEPQWFNFKLPNGITLCVTGNYYGVIAWDKNTTVAKNISLYKSEYVPEPLYYWTTLTEGFVKVELSPLFCSFNTHQKVDTPTIDSETDVYYYGAHNLKSAKLYGFYVPIGSTHYIYHLEVSQYTPPVFLNARVNVSDDAYEIMVELDPVVYRNAWDIALAYYYIHLKCNKSEGIYYFDVVEGEMPPIKSNTIYDTTQDIKTFDPIIGTSAEFIKSPVQSQYETDLAKIKAEIKYSGYEFYYMYELLQKANSPWDIQQEVDNAGLS